MTQNAEASTLKRAWLITWDWDGDHVKTDDSFVSILDWRIGSDKVKSFVEQLYVAKWLAFHEQLAYAKSKKNFPIQARYGTIKIENWQELHLPPKAQWAEQIFFWDNPFLSTRMVYNLKAYIDMEGQECLEFSERINIKLASSGPVSDWEDKKIVRKSNAKS